MLTHASGLTQRNGPQDPVRINVIVLERDGPEVRRAIRVEVASDLELISQGLK